MAVERVKMDRAQMTLDMRTIMVMLVVSSVLMAITLAIGTRMGRAAGFVKWNAGLGLLALGWVLVATLGVLPDLVAIALFHAILVAGLSVVLAGIIEFGGSIAPRLLLIAPGPLMLALLIPRVDDYLAQTLLMSVVLAAIFVAMAVAAARLGAGAGPARWMGRYGGEEFCAMLPGTDMQNAIAIAERLRGKVSQRPLGDLARAITVSIGVAACSGKAGVLLDAVIGRADEALYRAKHDGRDRVVGLAF